MFSSSQYDVGSTPSQTENYNNGNGPSPASKNKFASGPVPVTVKQISQASHSSNDDNKSNFVIDGVDVTNVKLVGMVSDKTEKVTDVSFVIDDGTGRIGCKRWVNEPFDRRQMEVIENGMYVQVVGHLKLFKNNTDIQAFDVRPVTNFDEVTHHFVECIYQHTHQKKSQLGGDSISQSQSSTIKSEPNAFHSSPPKQMGVDGLKEIDQRVLEFLNQPSSLAQEKGVHRAEIAKHLKLSLEKIMESITSLEEEGLVYSTIDENYYKSTSA